MNDIAAKSFSPQEMLGNIAYIKSIIQRIRQKEGGVGSAADELCLHRMIHDLDLLVDIVDALKAAHANIASQADSMSQALNTQSSQLVGLKGTYEKMLLERNKRIKELEQQLGVRPTPPPEQE